MNKEETNNTIYLASVYEYYGVLVNRSDYVEDILLHMGEKGQIVLDLEPYSNEILTTEEFRNRWQEIARKVEERPLS